MSRLATLLVLLVALAAPAAAQPGLIAQLKTGGYVLVMRHAHSPGTPPAPAAADPANRTDERQLDAEGKMQAVAIGRGLKAAGATIGPVWSSPTFRAGQTVQLMGLKAQTRTELGDGEAAVFKPDGKGGAALVGRIKPGDWPS